ncbi:UNVERIFIED_CONTAM: hypothetical protein ABID98_003945 [Brevibacillus sp. OAP136]
MVTSYPHRLLNLPVISIVPWDLSITIQLAKASNIRHKMERNTPAASHEPFDQPVDHYRVCLHTMFLFLVNENRKSYGGRARNPYQKGDGAGFSLISGEESG